MFLPELFHLCSILPLLLYPCSVFFTTHDGLITEGRGLLKRTEKGCQGVAAGTSEQLLHIEGY
jgi:hypothetical protein